MTSISRFYMVVNLTKMVSFVLTTAEGGLQDGPTDSRGSMVRPRCWLLPPQGNYWGQNHFLSIFSFTLKLFQTRRRIILVRYWVFQGARIWKNYPKIVIFRNDIFFKNPTAVASFWKIVSWPKYFFLQTRMKFFCDWACFPPLLWIIYLLPRVFTRGSCKLNNLRRWWLWWSWQKKIRSFLYIFWILRLKRNFINLIQIDEKQNWCAHHLDDQQKAFKSSLCFQLSLRLGPVSCWPVASWPPCFNSLPSMGSSSILCLFLPHLSSVLMAAPSFIGEQ